MAGGRATFPQAALVNTARHVAVINPAPPSAHKHRKRRVRRPRKCRRDGRYGRNGEPGEGAGGRRGVAGKIASTTGLRDILSKI